MSNSPSFFMIGAPKCGTTSVYDYLRNHPDVFVPYLKEPNYFAVDIDTTKFSRPYNDSLVSMETYFSEGSTDGRQIGFVKDEETYLRLYAGNMENKMAGDCSTSYMFSEEAAERIHRFNPGARIIVMLRNPVDRAISHFNMAVQMGLDSGKFEDAFERDRRSPEKGWGVSQLYFELGKYGSQLKRYYDLFGEDQICVLLLEDWTLKRKDALKRLCDFLNVPIFAGPRTDASNQGVAPVFGRFHKMLMSKGIKDRIRDVLPDSAFEKAKSVYYRKAEKKVSDEMRKKLTDLYLDEILLTQELIKRDLTNWIKL